MSMYYSERRAMSVNSFAPPFWAISMSYAASEVPIGSCKDFKHVYAAVVVSAACRPMPWRWTAGMNLVLDAGTARSSMRIEQGVDPVLPPSRNLVINYQVGSQQDVCGKQSDIGQVSGALRASATDAKHKIPGYTFLVSVGGNLITLPHGVGFENNSVKLEGAPHAWVAYARQSFRKTGKGQHSRYQREIEKEGGGGEEMTILPFNPLSR
ncbi:hypothetical protein M747DRAFT_304831 [Aspergillus niger ATCC 13496]|uniref:Uncharacterized protein n=1 Tax=Aspergillus niger ATCC 13496 TaxID=1353008 RepID=A0A370C0D8_ASPNG|nr:hypothetical protein M747DRAFT_304831 [Aspergillus niger ATCC 13496]